MKIDVIRKLPERLDTIVIVHHDNESLRPLEFMPEELQTAINAFVKAEELTFEYGKIQNFHHIGNKYNTKIILCGAGIPAC